MTLHYIAGLALVLATATTALASEKCTVPKAEWQPEAALRQKLEAQNWKIKNIKIDGGCYEVYGTDDKGERVEIYFNPKTLEAVNGSEG